MTQRLIAAVSAPTAEGVLYELDLRLRPSGNKGPVATHIDAFKKYQREDAWTWEHMALTRARTVAGDAALRAEIEKDVVDVIGLPRDRDKLAREATDMRKMIDQEKPPRDAWDIKLIPGGLIDLEFIAQYAVLAGLTSGKARSTSTFDTLSRLSPDFADAQVREDLAQAYQLYLTLTQMIRLCLTGPFDKDDVPPSLADLLLATTDLPDFAVLEAHLKESAEQVRRHFVSLMSPRRIGVAEVSSVIGVNSKG